MELKERIEEIIAGAITESLTIEEASERILLLLDVSGSFSYKTISAHNNDLYEHNGWAYKHLIELGQQGWEVVKIQPMHDCGSWVFLKNCR